MEMESEHNVINNESWTKCWPKSVCMLVRVMATECRTALPGRVQAGNMRVWINITRHYGTVG